MKAVLRITSLRSRIFLLISVILCLAGAATILMTQRDVKDTVLASETLAIHNVLNLLEREGEARWGSLLSDKIATVRRGRQQLIQLGTTVESVLHMFHEQVQRGELSVAEAQQSATQWINGLSIDKTRFSFVFNQSLTIIASRDPAMIGINLSMLRDIKGRLLASSIYQEARQTGDSLAIYRWPPQGVARDRELRYAYFAYFEPWDWIFAITDSAQEVAQQFDQRRHEMEIAIGETLASLQLEHSGIAFIRDEHGNLLHEPTHTRAHLFDVRDQNSGQTLLQMLSNATEDKRVNTMLFVPDSGETVWQISSVYFKPLKWTIATAVPTEQLTQAATALSSRLLALFLIVLAVSLALAWALSARITRPLVQLSNYARSLPEQDLSAGGPIPEYIQQLPLKQPDEVGRLAAAFMFMDRELREKIARLVQETSSRERLEGELSIARTIQMGLLPQPPDSTLLKQVDLDASMHPAKEVGGDLYDYFLLPDGRLFFAIGDVSDKGVPAALFMAFTNTLIRAWAADTPDPAALMARINDRLAENNPKLMFTTLMLAVLDLGSGELQWANAGHPPLCIVGPGELPRTLDGLSGPACGVQDGLVYRRFSATLAAGEYLLGYTDGVTEALAPDGGFYGDDRLLSLLGRCRPEAASGLLASVLGDLQNFVRDTEPSDDITLLAVRCPERHAAQAQSGTDGPENAHP